MIKPISDFAARLQTEVKLDEAMVIKSKDRYFLLNETLKKFAAEEFFYAGTYLGKVKGGKFFPSFSLLALMAKGKANKIDVDDRTEWLFICGRDIFKKGIVKVAGSKRRGDYTLVLNQHGECLGFGRILRDLSEDNEGAVVKNISDVGDFLRRERRRV